MFTSGQSAMTNAVFSLITFSVAIPSAIKIFNWLATMYKGSISLATPMLYALAFIWLFTIGGLTGVFLGALSLDIMAHGRSQNRILKELAPDEAAFRTLMRSWFEHSNLYDVLKNLARRDCTVILTTDHGSKLCQRAVKIRGNKDTSSNVRYKFGDNLGVDEEKVMLMKDPEKFRLPPQSTIENYAITSENYYLVYPTNFHEYERLYRNSFQHGGISLEEVMCPFVVMRPR